MGILELNKKKRFTDLKKNLPLLALTIPGMLYLLINNYFPMFQRNLWERLVWSEKL